MALGKIIANCAADTPRTGRGNCPKSEGKTMALLVTNASAKYPIDSTAFISALSGYVTDTSNLRMFPVTGIEENTVNGGDFQTRTTGYGNEKATGITPLSEIYNIDAGDCFYKELSKLNGRSVRVFRIDDEGFIYGTVIKEGDTEYFAGFEAQLYARLGRKTGADSDGTPYLRVGYTANYEKQRINAHAFEIPSIPEGLIGITLQKGATAGAAKVVSTCGGDDLTGAYAWDSELFIDATGTNPTTVAYNAATGYLTFTPAGSYRVVGASELEAADIFGLDGVEEYVAV